MSHSTTKQGMSHGTHATTIHARVFSDHKTGHRERQGWRTGCAQAATNCIYT
jgi:hypothetical protein